VVVESRDGGPGAARADDWAWGTTERSQRGRDAALVPALPALGCGSLPVAASWTPPRHVTRQMRDEARTPDSGLAVNHQRPSISSSSGGHDDLSRTFV
jgi:hypothetical protein